jgi:PAS domain S-box-containing protein
MKERVRDDGATDSSDAEESFFRTLAEMIPQMVWTKDANGLNDYCNRRFIEYMGVTMDEFIHNSWIVAHPDDVERGQRVWREAVASGSPYETELRLRPKDRAEYRWFLVRAVPQLDADGRVCKWYGTTTDIDGQKRYAQQQEETVRILVELFSPGDLPVLDHVTLDAVYVPAEHLAKVGGDFYEAVMLRDGRLLFAIGDVAGHGLGAAVAMERARNAIVSAAIESRNPAVVLNNVNRALNLRPSAPFVTAIVGFLDPIRGGYTYASAGHNAPIVAGFEPIKGLQPRGGLCARMLPGGGVPLGVEADPEFTIVNGTLEPGAMLVLYTDGIVEFDRDQSSGERKLLASALRVVDEKMPRPAEAIRHLVLNGATPTDDVALLTLTFAPRTLR